MMTDNNFCLYLHCRPDGSPFYVGKGRHRRAYDFSGRTAYHKRIVAKYGRCNIEVLVFPRDSERQASTDEVQWIAVLRKAGCRLANFCDGGEGMSGHRHSAQSLARMRLAKRNISEETRQRMRFAQAGRVNTPEAIAKMKLHHRHAKPWLGKHLSSEIRAKLVIANLGKKQSHAAREKKARAAKIAWSRPDVRERI